MTLIKICIDFIVLNMAKTFSDNGLLKLTMDELDVKGRSIVTLYDSREEAMSYVKQSLKRRQSSPRRIGVAYESVYSSPSFA
jgi:hypothetical protein